MTVFSSVGREPPDRLDPGPPAPPPPAGWRAPTHESFAAFYRTDYAKVTGQLYAYLGDAAEAEDVAQEAFVRAWQRWDRVGSYDDPLSWVRRVALNLATSRWRRLLVAARVAQLHEAPTRPPIGPEHVALVAALRTLPERQRLVMVLHYLADRSVAEIAEELGTPRNTVLSWLHRGRAKLADLLTEEVTSDDRAL